MILQVIRRKEYEHAKEGACGVFKALFWTVLALGVAWFYVVIAFTW